MKREKGFTLIELLVVIAIFGVLAAVIVPNIYNFLVRNERQAVQEAVIQMMKEEGFVSQNATDNMGIFPSPEHPLYPKYLDTERTGHSYQIEIKIKSD